MEMGGEVWDRFTVHYTPKHGSWLNQAEIEIGLFSRQCLGKRRIPDLKSLRRESRAWNRRMNRDKIKINWKFDRRTARRKFGYKRKSSSGQRPSRDQLDCVACRMRTSVGTGLPGFRAWFLTLSQLTSSDRLKRFYKTFACRSVLAHNGACLVCLCAFTFHRGTEVSCTTCLTAASSLLGSSCGHWRYFI